MKLLLAAVWLPILLSVLGLGVGLGLERASGRWALPRPLVLPLGVCGLLCLTQIFTTFAATAPATPWVAVVAGVAGLIIGRSRLRGLVSSLLRSPWSALAFAAAYLIAVAPVLAAGRVTLIGYLLDTTSAIQLLGAEHLIDRGRDLSGLGSTAAGGYMQAYFGTGYPGGSQALLGALGKLVPVDVLWLYQPYLAYFEALSALVLFALARRLGLRAWLAALAAVIGSASALLYAYQLQGSIKEVVVLPALLLLWALVLDHRGWLGARPWAVVPAVVAVGAGIATIGLAFAAWAAAAAVLLLVAALRRLRARVVRHLAPQLAVALVAFIVVAPQTLANLRASASLAGNLSQGNTSLAADPGNLLQPLHAVQVLGIWVNSSHRVDPSQHAKMTYALIGIALVAVALGIAALVRRRAWMAVGVVAASAALWWVLTKRGTEWTDAKLIVLTTPLVLLLAFVGAGSLASRGRRLEAAALALVLAVGVLWSDALLYHSTGLAPTDRFRELASVDDRFAHQGPTLLMDFDEYAMLVGEQLDVDAPGFAHHGPILSKAAAANIGFPYGSSPNLDQVPLPVVQKFPLLVLRRSAEQSRPPTGYDLAWRGRWYDVWRRGARSSAVLVHLGAGGGARRDGGVTCRQLRGLARTAAGAGGPLMAAFGPSTIVIDPRSTVRSANWSGDAAGEGVTLVGPGSLTTEVRVPVGGVWRLWLRGDVARPVQIFVDGRKVGSRGYEAGADPNYLPAVEVPLTRGKHSLMLLRGGGSLAPGDGGATALRRMSLELARPESLVTVPAARWRELCGRDVDWVEGLDRSWR